MAASNLNSNQNLYVHTASVAGGCGIKSVTTTSDLIVRIEELAKSYGRLFASNLVTRSDEVALARRRYQFLTGPSGIAELKRTLKEGSVNCWRCTSSERQQYLNLFHSALLIFAFPLSLIVGSITSI